MANNKNLPGTLGIIAAIIELSNLAIPLAEKLIKDFLAIQPSKNKDTIIVPDIYDKDYPIDLERAKTILDIYGLKAMPYEMPLKEADPKFRECFDMQVIGSKPAYKKTVNKGSVVYVRYITQAVIDESIHLYEAEQEKLAMDKKEKEERRAAQIAKVKEGAAKAVDNSLDTMAQLAGKTKKIFLKNHNEKSSDETEE